MNNFEKLDFSKNRICCLLNIQYPIIQGGMVWCSGWKLASAVSNAGGLGLIGSGSMPAELLLNHIRSCKQATNKPFGINVPLHYAHTPETLKIIEEEQIKIIVTSAGNPALYTQRLKSMGCIVGHVVSNSKFAQKAAEAGVDFVIAEGVEAGGHNGKDELTTMCLTPQVRQAITIPLVAAGGIATGKAMLAAFALGADAVQCGTRFALTQESSAHPNFKQAICNAKETDTSLILRTLTPVRVIKNTFSQQISALELSHASPEELKLLLGKGRSKKGIFEGDLSEGELEAGQISGLLNNIPTTQEVIQSMITEFYTSLTDIYKDYVISS
ncbi:MAG: nitronate monooxygenase [Bacteroidia bacterium]|nr:nitronate monooxygenase [Bacteroidia bacterium]